MSKDQIIIFSGIITYLSTKREYAAYLKIDFHDNGVHRCTYQVT